jgi:hypothetical protein
MHPELALNQSGDPFEGPALSAKAGRHRASIQEPTQTDPVAGSEPGWSPCSDAGGQAAPAPLGQRETLARLTPSWRAI